MAVDGDGKILGIRVATTANMGAYLSNFGPFIPTACSAKMLSGLYDIPAIYAEVACVFTNSVPVDAYRGAGRPEAAYVVERLIDEAAHVLGLSQEEMRRRNFITKAQLPFRTQVGETYDSGDFEHIMNEAMAAIAWQDFPRRRARSQARGRERGLGMACYVEACAAVGNESARLSLDAAGSLHVVVGTQDNGQGHKTAYTQIFSDLLGLAPEAIHIEQGDSDVLTVARGTSGSRSLLMGGQASILAAEKVIAAARSLAADLLEAAEADIEFQDGRFTIVGTDRRLSLAEVARESHRRGSPITEEATYKAPAMTYPNGCHICEIEVDTETGRSRILRYLVVDDFGKLVNPLLVAGQVYGGIAQGVGQALLESTVYDDESGQLLSGSFMDYTMPRADDLPAIELSLLEDTPCTTNPMGIKGAGEAGAIGACPAVMNALLDALRPLGVRRLDMPATPERVWRALCAAQRNGAN
jgi:carbon-monoxide dehydrogenase large subunit